MPWKVTCAVEQRERFVEEVMEGFESLSELCRLYGISRTTGYKWLRRFEGAGRPGLEDVPRAPHRHPNQTPEGVEETILALRDRRPYWGARKLRAILLREHPGTRWPVQSTIGEILRRHGLTVPRKRRRRIEPHTEPFAACDAPNALWCADYKGWFRTRDGSRCDPLTITDATSRYLLRCRIVPKIDGANARRQFEATFKEFGLPVAMRTDNGTPFASRGIGGLSRLSVWWIKLGIAPERIAPAQPQQNGRHERIHLTLKHEALGRVEATPGRQQRVLDGFRKRYNEERPHEALDMTCPAAHYRPSPRPYPRREPEVTYPGDMSVRLVQARGEFHWHGDRVFLGEALCHEPIGLEPIDGRYWTLYFAHVLLGVFDEATRHVLCTTDARLPEQVARVVAGPRRDAPRPRHHTPDPSRNCKPCARYKL
jgi:transposase InsO family protein